MLIAFSLDTNTQTHICSFLGLRWQHRELTFLELHTQSDVGSDSISEELGNGMAAMFRLQYRSKQRSL